MWEEKREWAAQPKKTVPVTIGTKIWVDKGFARGTAAGRLHPLPVRRRSAMTRRLSFLNLDAKYHQRCARQ